MVARMLNLKFDAARQDLRRGRQRQKAKPWSYAVSGAGLGSKRQKEFDKPSKIFSKNYY